MNGKTGRPWVSCLLIIALPLVASCSSWQQTTALHDSTARAKRYTQMRVETEDEPVLFLRDPWFGGDTLYGRTMGNVRTSDGVKHKRGEAFAVPVEKITKLEVHRFSGSKTVICVLGIGLVAAVAIAMASSDWGMGGTSFGGGGDYGTYSCPLLYSWDGGGWKLDSGTYAGAIMPALSRTDVDNLDQAREFAGKVRIRVTGAPGETEHLDALRLLAVDHDPHSTIVPDGSGNLHALGMLRAPLSAEDFRHRDVLALVRSSDARSWESIPTKRDTTRADEVRDGLEIEFQKDEGATEARLLVDGSYTVWADYLMGEYVRLHGRDTDAWYQALAADPRQALTFARAIAREAFLSVSVWDGTGWRPQGLLPGAGPELSKRQVVRLDLANVRTKTVRVRLETAPSFWLLDRVAMDFGPERGFVVHEIAPGAEGAGAPDLLANLDRIDRRAEVFDSSDSLDLFFAVPPVPHGGARTYLAATTGWYRMHTPSTGDPDWTLSERLIEQPGAISRMSVARLNEALDVMSAAAAAATQ